MNNVIALHHPDKILPAMPVVGKHASACSFCHEPKKRVVTATHPQRTVTICFECIAEANARLQGTPPTLNKRFNIGGAE